MGYVREAAEKQQRADAAECAGLKSPSLPDLLPTSYVMTLGQTDLFAGSDSDAAPVGPAPVSGHVRELSDRIPAGLRLGTSSWTFPGWAGIVYDRTVDPKVLVSHGLEAYGRHPLLKTVGVDRSYYRPIPKTALQSFARAVPPEFRFVLKGPRDCLSPTLGSERGLGTPNPLFLDGEFAAREFVEPVVSVLAESAGPLVFQFSSMRLAGLGGPAAFLDRLGTFLRSLPRGPLYAVEIRNPELLTTEYRDALTSANAVHCFNVHPAMPGIRTQSAVLGPETQRVLVVRWMLGQGLGYERARDRYQPFDRLVDEDPSSRNDITDACLDAMAAGRGAFVIVNNKAEGSSPLSIVRLVEAIVDGASASDPEASSG